MRPLKILKLDWCQRLIRTSFVALLLVTLSVSLSGAWWNFGNDQQPPARESRLAQGNAITDGKALLRYSLPIENQAVRNVQASLEDIAIQLRGKRWSPINRDITKADVILSNRPEKVLADIPEEQKPQAEAIIAAMKDDIISLREAVETRDKEAIWIERGKLLDKVGELERMMVKGFPFKVPSEYSNLPQLKGRATVEIATNKGKMTLVVDGYSAPVTAGNFVDLVQRGFYDDLA
ncbi:MAG: peptidylprolyl isomerase, partial [Coleofasciculus sp. C2-GNP5-27]